MTDEEAAPAEEPGTRSYRPGEWFGIFGESVTVLLPPSEKSRVAGIWALVDDGAGFDEVLDALIAHGLRQQPGFVLVSESDGETKVVVRGPARAEFTTDDDTVTVEGSALTTWAERSLTGVRGMRIQVADDRGGDDLVIRHGLVRLARADRPAVTREAPGRVQVVGPGDRAPDVNVMDRAALDAIPTEVQPDPDPEPAPDADADQETQPLPGPAAGSLAGAPDPDGVTQAGNWRLGDLTPGQQGDPGQPPAPGVLATPVARLRFSNGEVVDVDQVVVVGRAPEARRSTSAEQPRLVTVPSPHQEISATHLEVRPGTDADHGAAVVTDLGSTNGTVLQQPGLEPEDLQPGVAVQLLPGAVIDLGDGVSILVSHP